MPKRTPITRPEHLLGRLLADRRADTAVEFALIGAAFFLLLTGIFAISIGQFWQMVLDDAVRNATRQVQIGSVKTGTAFVSAVCAEFGIAAPGCTANLQYSVQSASSFSAITPATVNNAGTLSGGNKFAVSKTASTPTLTTYNTYTTTVAPEFLLVQVAYTLPFHFFAIPSGFVTENGTSAIISSVATDMEP